MKEIESSGFLKNGLMEQLPFLEEVYQETIAVKVLSIDKKRIEYERGACSMINGQLFK